ncbi:MAG TPA: PaaI family thioesterase [Candidatus Acidoferrum sp.]|nr:PaaI family thioesterase [Candidatus Acidoferrum sp.]
MARSKKRDEHPTADVLRQRLAATNLARQFGFVLTTAESGHVIIEMPVDERHKQTHGVVHGGVMAALADTAGGLATYMACPPGKRVATIEMKVNYLEAVSSGRVSADARVVRLGAHVAVVDCDVRDETHRLVGKALMTFFVAPLDKKGQKPKKARRPR